VVTSVGAILVVPIARSKNRWAAFVLRLTEGATINDVGARGDSADRIGMLAVLEEDVPADLVEIGVGLDTSIHGTKQVLQHDHAQRVVADHPVVADNDVALPKLTIPTPVGTPPISRDRVGKVVVQHLVALDHDVVGERPGVVGKHGHIDPGRVLLQQVVPQVAWMVFSTTTPDHIVRHRVVPDGHLVVVADIDAGINTRPLPRQVAPHDLVEVDQPVA
jgi:hypothetical protein